MTFGKPDDGNRAERLRQVIDDCARRHSNGEELHDEHVMAAHPELMPELGAELRLLRLTRTICPPSEETVTESVGQSAPTRDRAIPAQIRALQLIEEIGRGAMGVVYRARDQMLRRDVAVKFLLHAYADSGDPAFRVFLDGARAAAAVRHPGLNTIFQADVIDGIPYLVMEYVNGPTLSRLLRTEGVPSCTTAVTLIASVSEAVAELHKHDIIHRDIKPSNVLLDSDGRVFVTDFGLALARPTGAEMLSRASAAGTVPYMAPEAFEGTVSPRSDVYALGIMTFELLSGMLPFQGTVEEIAQKHRTAPLPVDVLEQRGVDGRLIDVILRATHKNVVFRYRSAMQFLRALEKSGLAEARGQPRLLDVVKAVRIPCVGDDSSRARNQGGSEPGTYYATISRAAATKRAERPERPAQPASAEAQIVAPADAVRADTLCVSCEYNLRSLSAAGKCPECGTPIADSLKWWLTIYPEQARRLHANSKLFFYPSLFLGGLGAIMVLAELASARSFTDAVVSVFYVGLFCATLSLLVALVGIVVLTGRHSAAYYRARYVNRHFLVWAGVFIVLGVVGLALILYYGGYYAQAVMQVAMAAGPLAVFLQRLSEVMRVPNKKQARFANLALALTCALAGTALAILVLQRFAPPGSRLAWLVAALTSAVDLGGITLAVVILRLLVLARRAWHHAFTVRA